MPERAQQLADKCYRLWQSNPNHRSIRFKKLEGHPTLYSARVGIHYRAIAQREGDILIWGLESVITRNTTRCLVGSEGKFIKVGHSLGKHG